MAFQITLAVLSAILMVYIIILKVKLSNRNLFIETTLKKLSGIGNNGSTAEMMEFIEDLHKSVQYSSFLNDKLLNRETTDFIYEDTGNMHVFMHYTREESDAKRILSAGFRFAESFHRTAVPVTRDNLDLKMKHNDRKLFGDYLIIICISNDIVHKYTSELEKAGLRNYSLENILTELPPVKNENADMIYQLPAKFVKGYVNYKTGEIVKNPEFNPFYNSPSFSKNIAVAR